MSIDRILNDDAFEAAENSGGNGLNPFATESQIAALAPQNALVSGGATWNSGLIFDVTALTYWLNGVLYSSSATQITLPAADPTDPRIDIIAVDSAGVISVISGTPAPSPVKPELDLSTYVEVTFVTVDAGATEPTIMIEDVYLENTGGPAEWNTGLVGGTIVNNSTNDPYAGTVSLEGTNCVTGNRIDFLKVGGYTINLTSVIEFKIKLKNVIGNNERFRLRFRNGGANLGVNVDVRNGRYGFDRTNTTTYQSIAIPMSVFQVSGLVTELRLTCNNIATNVGFFIDNVRIQEGFGVSTGVVTAPDVNYSPTTPGDWDSIPSNVQEALDFLITHSGHESYTTTEMFNIVAPEEGMTIFNSTLSTLAYWNNTSWISVSGTPILQEDFNEDFESGSLATNSWIKVDGGENDFEIGTATQSTGTFGVYISNDGGTSNNYTSLGGGLDVSHLYRDFTLPAASNSLVLEFDWRCEAEIGFDWGEVFICETSVTPTANTELVDNGTTIIKVGLSEYNNQSIYTTESINLPLGMAGTSKRIVFSWRNDTSVENQPPMAIDNVKILFS